MQQSFVESFGSVLAAVSSADRQILNALAKSPDQSASASELRQALGLRSVVQINGAMGRIGRKLHEAFGQHPDGLLQDEFQWWHMIATGEAIFQRGFVWKLRAEVIDALIDYGDSTQNHPSASKSTESAQKFWTAHWQQSGWNPNTNIESQPIQASGSAVLEARGVEPGDVLYIISLSDGHLLLGGRMVVASIVSRDTACQMLGKDSLFEADQWAINITGGSPLHLHRRLAPDLAKKLLFVRSNGERGLTFIDDTNLDNQATRGLGRLTTESASLLDSIIEQTDSMPYTSGMLTVTEDLLLKQSSPGIRSTLLETAELTTLTAPIFEGLANRLPTTVRERSQQARDICINQYGYNCAVCDVNFEERYGSIGKGYIHVHHLELLSNSDETHEVDPIKDLIPICPNCHAMVHRKTPPISIAEMRAILAAQKCGSG